MSRSISETWAITFDGEADDTFDRLLDSLRGYIVRVKLEQDDGTFIEKDVELAGAFDYYDVDEDHQPIGEEKALDGLVSVHVY